MNKISVKKYKDTEYYKLSLSGQYRNTASLVKKCGGHNLGDFMFNNLMNGVLWAKDISSGRLRAYASLLNKMADILDKE